MIKKFEPTAASLLISEGCNMACKYCFEVNGIGHNSSSMTEDVAYKTIDYLFSNALRIKRDEERDVTVSLTLFGGEPMLKPDLVCNILDKGLILSKELGIGFGSVIVTNGTLIPDETVEKLRTIYRNGASFAIQISVDSIKEYNDQERVFRNGSGTFDTIINNLPKFKSIFQEGDDEESYQGKIHIHGSLVKRTLPHLFETYKEFSDVHNIRDQWFMPIQSEKWDEEDAKIYVEELNKIKDHLLDKIRQTKNPKLENSFATFKRRVKREGVWTERPCGAGSNFITVTANGSILPCHQFYYQKGLKESLNIGNIDDLKNLEFQKLYLFMNYDSRDISCSIDKDCDLVDVCYRCIADSYSATGSTLQMNYSARCQMTKGEANVSADFIDELNEIPLNNDGCNCDGTCENCDCEKEHKTEITDFMGFYNND